ncbi:LOW QUALITY PROTEIN: GDNF family receptor alpha-like [Balaenoptera ricei]|uniref:LOW QUALITY PROTEIN: GDNF family receptor alpha-like n=1 Tax=Balaenoptera ricei TaxID=2746895 RepID=UPI0028BEC83F|nr:LOW QUALITY PROTEIN: GDNF family receptor alpha-like [Balaenoptera ricei]
MIVFIFFAVGLCLDNESTSQTIDCTYLRELCLSDADGCKHAWRIMEDACNVSGNPCQMKDSSSCNLSIRSLAESNFQFKNCLCSDDLYCTIKKLLGKKCINKSEESALSSYLAAQSNITQWLHQKDKSLMIEKKSYCVMAARICQESEHCALLYENFKKTCGRESEQCKTLDGSYLCAALRESLKETILWNCQCNDPSEAKCIEIWKSLFEDICIQDAQMNPVPAFSEDNEDEFNLDIVSDNMKEDNKFKWNLTTLSYHGVRGIKSCLEVAKECVADVLCNTQLALYLKACSANGNLCDVKHCQAAIQFFYQNMPFNTAQMLAFCDCAPSDVPCQQSREALHSKPCAVNRVPAPTCLDIIHSCQNDELCRRRYRTFQAKCWQRVIRKCHEDETCISTLSKQDLTCSGSNDCKAAYIGTLGTVLQVQCTCRTTTQSEESLCKIFQHMLHRKSCFNYLTLHNVKGIALHKGKHAKEITLSGFHSPFNEVIYAVMCMTVICGILLLVMVKLRTFRISSKTRDPSPIRIPGGLMIH